MPLTARSSCCGVRGGSTEIVGTTLACAPWRCRRANVEADCSFVRGTSTSHPNSGLLSNHDNVSRMVTVDPTTASTGKRPSAIVAPAEDSVVVTVRWSVLVPRSVTATGVAPSRPAAMRASKVWAALSGAPMTTTVTLGSSAPVRSTPRAPATRTCTPVELADVSGTPAYEGTAVTELTPGTTSKDTPAFTQAVASSASPLKTAGSPSMRRTTRPPGCAFAARTTSLARDAWVRFSPWSPWPASTTGVPGAHHRSTTSCRATWSMTTASAAASSSLARTVSSPGSPGPAPTKATWAGVRGVEGEVERVGLTRHAPWRGGRSWRSGRSWGCRTSAGLRRPRGAGARGACRGRRGWRGPRRASGGGQPSRRAR
jgi:hypothetical protein